MEIKDSTEPPEDMLRSQAQATVQIDDDNFRVTEWRFAPGTETGWHRHELDYVVVPMTTGALQLQTADGESLNELTAGQSYTRPAGSEHNVVNPGPDEFVFVEIEAKQAAR
ncbi:cupin domain-containing protein [Crystallibacter crystallopoietes]|nr:cupin domain-containing protein [Arthrobacter crystallopoietes]